MPTTVQHPLPEEPRSTRLGYPNFQQGNLKNQLSMMADMFPSLDSRPAFRALDRGIRIPKEMDHALDTIAVLPNFGKLSGHENVVAQIILRELGIEISPSDCIMTSYTAQMLKQIWKEQRGGFAFVGCNLGRLLSGHSMAEMRNLVKGMTGVCCLDVLTTGLVLHQNPSRFADTADPLDAAGSKTFLEQGFYFCSRNGKLRINTRNLNSPLENHGCALAIRLPDLPNMV